jgi:H/ACA ribonucleoprotein complex subunit 1
MEPEMADCILWRGGGGSRGAGRGRVDPQALNNPERIEEFAKYLHPAKDNTMVFKQLHSDFVPKFASPIFLQNKEKIGTVDEIFGPINDVHLSVNPVEGIQAANFTVGSVVYIGSDRVLPARMFLEENNPKGKQPGGGRGGRGGFQRGGRRGRGFQRGGGGFNRSAGRGRSPQQRGGGRR